MFLPPSPTIFLTAILVLLGFGTTVHAQSAVEPWAKELAEKGEEVNSQQQIRRLVRQLDANQFAARQQASEELSRRGKAAIPAIEQAALTGSSEVINRSMALLKTFAGSPEDETAQMAIAALQRLAASNSGSVAHHAGNVIDQLRRVVGPGRIESLQQELPAAPLVEVQRSVRLSNVEGKRTIDVTENGQRVVAVLAPDGEVRLTWHSPDGREKTVSAATAEELKRQDPASFAKLQELIQIAENIPGMQHLRRMPPVGPGLGEGFDPLARLPRQVFRVRRVGPPRLAEKQPRVAVRADQFTPLKERIGKLLQEVEAGDADGINLDELEELDEALERIKAAVQSRD